MKLGARAKECAAHFQNHPGYRRAFEQMRKKWKSYGRCAGVVILNDATPTEQAALSQFFGKHFFDQKIRFSLADWEAELLNTSFSDVSFLELLEAYFQESMESTKENATKAKEALECFFEQLKSIAQRCDGSWALTWIQSMWEEKTSGYPLLISLYKKDAKEALKRAHTVVNALAISETHKQTLHTNPSLKRNQPLRLAVCASQAAGYPHALDYQQMEGKLFIQALCCIFEHSADSAEERMEVYYQAGLVADTLSSFTIGRGLLLLEKDGSEHPGYQVIRQRNEICHLSLETLSGLVGADSLSKRVFVLENQMVFSQLCGLSAKTRSVILCTSGQCRTASLILLDMLRDQGCEIWYSGDYDPEGMLIADKLVRRGKGKVHLWHYSVDEYIAHQSTQEVKAESLKMLDRLVNKQLKEIAAVMLVDKRAAYQEKLLEVLHQDLMSAM